MCFYNKNIILILIRIQRLRLEPLLQLLVVYSLCSLSLTLSLDPSLCFVPFRSPFRFQVYTIISIRSHFSVFFPTPSDLTYFYFQFFCLGDLGFCNSAFWYVGFVVCLYNTDRFEWVFVLSLIRSLIGLNLFALTEAVAAVNSTHNTYILHSLHYRFALVFYFHVNKLFSSLN